MNLENLYKIRFKENDAKNGIWKVLCKNFFQKFIDEQSTVVDISAGYCEFINNIKAKKKIAFDLNPETKNTADKDVEVFTESCEKITEFVDKNSVDVVFVSNFFEHLDRKEQIIDILEKTYKILKTGGKVLILQPNIMLVKEAYWHFIDHKLPLTDLSIVEAGEMAGFKVRKKISRFLPYTTKSKIPQCAWMVRLYLLCRPLSSIIMGKQSFIVLEK